MPHVPPWLKMTRLIVGWTLIAIGLVATLVPVFPQMIFFAVGAILLAPYVRVFRRFSAWIHKRFPHARGPMRSMRRIGMPPAQTKPPNAP